MYSEDFSAADSSDRVVPAVPADASSSLVDALGSALLGEALDDVVAVASRKRSAPEDSGSARAATLRRVDAFVRAALDATGASSLGVTPAVARTFADSRTFDEVRRATKEDARMTAAANEGRGVNDASATEESVPDLLLYDTVAEIVAETAPPDWSPDRFGGAGGSVAVASGALTGDRLRAAVVARAAASIAPPGGGRTKVDDVVRDDARASDDARWYAARETRRAILVRLAEDIFDECVADAVLANLA